MRLSQDQQATLWDLRFHWEDAYRIDTDGLAWTAIPLFAPGDTISRASSGELRSALRYHYAEHKGQRTAGHSST